MSTNLVVRSKNVVKLNSKWVVRLGVSLTPNSRVHEVAASGPSEAAAIQQAIAKARSLGIRG